MFEKFLNKHPSDMKCSKHVSQLAYNNADEIDPLRNNKQSNNV